MGAMPVMIGDSEFVLAGVDFAPMGRSYPWLSRFVIRSRWPTYNAEYQWVRLD